MTHRVPVDILGKIVRGPVNAVHQQCVIQYLGVVIVTLDFMDSTVSTLAKLAFTAETVVYRKCFESELIILLFKETFSVIS